MKVSGTGRVSLSDIYRLAEWVKRSYWQGVKYIRAWKPLKFLTTNDLDEKRKLKKNYLADRERRKKEREKSSDDGFFWIE